MFSAGIRNPQRSVLICVAIFLIACASIAWGVIEMQAAGQETLGSGLKIGIALLPAILAPFMALNFWGGMKVIAAARRGEKQIARWTVPAAELGEFVASNNAQNALKGDTVNDWSPPRDTPQDGIEVVFVPDGVLVGDTYFALVTTGLFRFSGVRMLIEGPPVIAFRTHTTYANRFGLRTTGGELRIPVALRAGDGVARVVDHFQRVLAGTTNANPDFYLKRMRIGMIAAPVFLAIAALGFVLGPTDMSDGAISVASVMVIVGLVFGIGALILALAARLMDGVQRRRAQGHRP